MTYPFRQDIPLYIQLVNAIKLQLVDGTYQAGDRLPSIRDLAVAFSVTPNTLQRALQQLEEEGLIYTERTAGKYVTPQADRLDQLRQDILADSVRTLFHDMLGKRFTQAEIEAAIRKELTSHEE